MADKAVNNEGGNIWKTNISKVYWNRRGKIEAAKLFHEKEGPKEEKKGPREVSWFDELFIKGIEVFRDPKDFEDPIDFKSFNEFEESEKKKTYPVTMLLKGPPGDGKTTLALELCHHLGKNRNGIRSTYISLESERKQIIANFDNYGWSYDEKNHLLNVCGLERTLKWTEALSKDLSAENKKTWSKLLAGLTDEIMKCCGMSPVGAIVKNVGVKLVEQFVEKQSDFIKYQEEKEKLEIMHGNKSKILVIDSLNVIPINLRTSVFLNFLKLAKRPESEIKLIIFILDGKSDNDYNPFWEYMCDTIIELSHHSENGYLLKTIEVIKARFQKHVLGKHQIKIYGKPTLPKKNNSASQGEEILVSRQRQHPCLKNGGVFIFPSIHFYLSQYNKLGKSRALEYEATCLDPFNKFLDDKGFPKGRCTAFIGCRGGHKSHLAFLHILSRLTGTYSEAGESSNDAALIISLRDDEMMIAETLEGILENEIKPSIEDPKEDFTIEGLINANRLEILYYPPGYISPEEFVHRIFVSINKLKSPSERGKERNVTVVFNSIDQISARFPLCAKFDMFIPSIIQILVGEGVTSLFVAVDEKDQPVEQYGLLPMADLILSFHRYNVSKEDYSKILEEGKEEKTEDEANEKEGRDEVFITVDRFAGGKKAGNKGLLELLPVKKSDKTKKKLRFVQLRSVYLKKEQRTD